MRMEEKIKELEKKVDKLEKRIDNIIKELKHVATITIIEEDDLEIIKPKKHSISIHELCNQTKINKKISTKIVRV